MALGDRLRELRAEQAELDAQLDQVADEADDARLRAMVADTPLARHDHHDARASADTLTRRLARVTAKVTELEARQDELLEKLTALHG